MASLKGSSTAVCAYTVPWTTNHRVPVGCPKHNFLQWERYKHGVNVFYLLGFFFPESEGMWSFSQDLTAILVKQEPNLLVESAPSPAPQPLNLAPPPRRRSPEVMVKTRDIALHLRHLADAVIQSDLQQSAYLWPGTSVLEDPRGKNRFKC